MNIEEILEKMINIQSINPPGLENAMCEYVFDLLKDNCDEIVKVNISDDRYNIISKINGLNNSSGIIFSGHMDVVPVSEVELKKWNSNPFEATYKDGYLYGRGSADMKSGLAAAIGAFINIYNSKIKPNKDIFLVATVDEEDFMSGSKAVYNHELLKNAKDVVIMEPTNLEICNIGRGRTYGEIKFLGTTGHGSQNVSMGNTILMANSFINEMYKIEFPNTKYGKSFWQPVSINAGVEPCVVPDETILKIDARLNPLHDPEDIWKNVDNILNTVHSIYSNSKSEINIIDKRSGFVNNDPVLLENIESSLKKLNLPLINNIFMGTTDGCQFLKENRNIVIIGPGDLSTVHKENEKVSIEQFKASYELYLSIMSNL